MTNLIIPDVFFCVSWEDNEVT